MMQQCLHADTGQEHQPPIPVLDVVSIGCCSPQGSMRCVLGDRMSWGKIPAGQQLSEIPNTPTAMTQQSRRDHIFSPESDV